MDTTCLEREGRFGEYDVVNISDYGFEWFVNNKLVKTGLVENKENDIKMLIEEGFVIVK